ncbi:SusC/RagA family TonB-linked outer membrane protein [Hymenobacter busanensis]|uniref:SusC/RagA family TonB-linked outer membrane protein n=1 Tax=Hymenobacter busanensis TaxID=2607656 RepID=A0A7L5A168_9BACT|nr:SusC/RagA family TonB-linked outer membrane protein [Hymenobacter busanensis]KAA9338308.1 SusC/RagA family TonB-linked outer membrane protein [Hymenobacter busanensis]QHJ09268.1 SusC/RagA family TonB-linked outer membrane protein [Hymenobacter busanensis]
MKKTLFMAGLLTTSLLQQAEAQVRTITGRVTDAETNTGLPGVTVLVKGTPTGTSSNSEGQFTLEVPANATTLVFSFVGYTTVERPIGNASTIDVRLATDTKQLGEVVVTALGREEEKKSLGYSVQDVKGADLTQARETNVVNSLQGKVAGVQISNSSGQPGSSSRIVIRGAKSVTGSSQPLFVIDGQPIDNSNFANSGPNGGVDYGNAASDINPDDIESMTILKGANAAALYGSRGANGVIVITTKSGRKNRGLGISINSTTTFETPLKLPEYQNEYGQGNAGEFEFVDGQGSGTNDGVDESWGPKLDGRLIPQFNSPVVNGVRQATPWVAHPDNVKNFFETGRTLTNNVALSGGNDKSGIRVSYTNLDQKGLLPNTFLRRNTVNVNGGTDITDKFKVSTNINYSETRGRRPQLGYSSQNPMQQFVWFGRQVDISELKNYSKPNDISGTKYNWNYNYHNNPYFTLYENQNNDRRDRVIGNLTLTYSPVQWLTLTARTTNDFYNQINTRRIGLDDIEQTINDDYTEDKIFVLERNTEFLATINRNITEDINLDVLVGANRRDNRQEYSSIAAPDLAVPGLFNLSNSSKPLAFNTTSNNNTAVLNPISKRRVNSLYGSAKIGYRNFAFLGGTVRNDWSSTLSPDNNSYFYPSIDGSFVITEALGIENSPLSFAKVRAGYAEVGNDTNPYNLRNYYLINQPYGGDPAVTVGNTLLNPDLKPERTKSLEAGVEVRFLQDRIGLELTGYKTNSIDQILAVPVSASTGYLAKSFNAGKISNRGIEAILNVAPLAADNPFQWNLTANFAANRNRVDEFDKEGQIKTLVLGTTWSMNVEARVNETYGAFFGNDFLRVKEGQYAGQIIYDEDGLPQSDPTRKVLGNYTPDWIGGLNNAFSYKGVNFSFLIDTRQGGDIFSVTNLWGNYAGTLATSLPGREGGIIGEGVKENADGSFSPNDIKANAEDYYKARYINSIHTSSIFDASFVKLREVKLGYQLPKSLVEKTFLKGIGVSAVGRNLWIIHSNAPNIDPESAFNNGNAQGLEFGQIPSTRSYGFNINLTL